MMLPAIEIEVRPELAIDPGEKVFVELRSHTGAVVVRALENISIFLEINDDQQTAAVAGELDHAGQELASRFRFEITNGRSRKINHAARRKVTRQRQFEWFEIISADRQDLQGRKHFSKSRGRFFKLLLRDVDWDVNGRIVQFFEQDSCFCSSASAETDQFDLRTERLC